MSNVSIPQEEIEKVGDEELHEMVAEEIKAIANGIDRYGAIHARNLVALMAEADLRRRNDKFLKRSEAGSSGPYPLD